MRRDKRIEGGMEIVGCKNNMIRPINTKVCRNNCNKWDFKNKRCSWGIK